MLLHTVRHVVANCRASPAMLACSRRTCSVAQRQARVVSIARGLAMPESCSVNKPTVLLCPHHHHLVEPDLRRPPDERWEITFDARGNPQFTGPAGPTGVRITRQHARFRV